MQKEHSILVIDDDNNLRCTLAQILLNAGYRVRAAHDYASAQEALANAQFDLIFLDLRMPDGEGISLLSELREANPNTSVLILTAYASLESAIEALRLGARDYLLKPVDPEQILHRVEHVLAENQKPLMRHALLSQIHSLLQEIDHETGSIPGAMNAENVPSQPANKKVAVYDTPIQSPRANRALLEERFLFCGPFKLDLHARHLFFEYRFIQITPTAFDYLHTLMRHSPQPVNYEALVAESQGFRVERIEAQEIARWRIHELRKAIEPDVRQPRYIITIRGEGYRLLT